MRTKMSDCYSKLSLKNKHNIRPNYIGLFIVYAYLFYIMQVYARVYKYSQRRGQLIEE